MEAEIPMKNFETEYKKRDLSDEFQTLYDITYSQKHQMRMNNDPAVYNLNRYVDILPYDDTRVILTDGRTAEESYINADYISSSVGLTSRDNKIIAT